MTHAADTLERLQRWYLSMSNGDWAHQFGIDIRTLDNPGWVVKIDLRETDWANLAVPHTRVERSERDWYSYLVADGQFVGQAGALNLGEVIEIFLSFVVTQ